jgi:hypothetical protein
LSNSCVIDPVVKWTQSGRKKSYVFYIILYYFLQKNLIVLHNFTKAWSSNKWRKARNIRQQLSKYNHIFSSSMALLLLRKSDSPELFWQQSNRYCACAYNREANTCRFHVKWS